MRSFEIRKRFLDFFASRGHKIIPSDSLIPRNDPTLLFTGSGMNQFKDEFLGRNVVARRAATCQKCLRTGDLENVGKTPRHHTFFEMLGNFSFGDYFKKDAIAWAWEFMTLEMRFPKERLWVSVHEDDEESYQIWLDDIKVPAGRIVRLTDKENFWPQEARTKGPNGPCGPCSEIFYDWGPGTGCGRKECGPSCGCERFVEVWNLVFTEFDRTSDGKLANLPNKNIDTGMGLERIASVAENVMTNFETDLFVPIIEGLKKAAAKDNRKTSARDLNLAADHVRAAVFAIADGVSPSNEKRGYVVRKLIRRAYLALGGGKPFLYNAVPAVVALMEDVYPELAEKREHASSIIREEEARFKETLEGAMPIFEEMVSRGKRVLAGGDVFKLVDTYGLPFEVIIEKAAARKVAVDTAGFEKLMAERKETSRRGSDIRSEFIFQPDLFKGAPKPPFSDKMPLETNIVFILKEAKEADRIEEGERAEIITDPQSSSLYAESGGQVGDSGKIKKDNALLEALDTYDADGRKIMEVEAVSGSFKKGDAVLLEIDTEKRARTAANHTATHLLQAALRAVLGEHVRQSGSLVEARRLRFDFTHVKKLSERELRKVEDLVNEWIASSLPVSKEVKGFDDARNEGALSFFGEKYGGMVRVVSVGDVSKELCGGSHVDNVSEIGLMKITSESSVAAGIRRVEAVTGETAELWINEEAERVAREAVERERRKKQKEDSKAAFASLKEKLDRLAAAGEKIGGAGFIYALFEDTAEEALKKAVIYAEEKAHPAVLLLGSSSGGKVFFLCSVPDELVKKGVSARELILAVSAAIGGGGGGDEKFARGGGRNAGGLPKAVEEVKRILKERLL